MTYTVHPDSLFDPDAPILGSTHQEARDNLTSVISGENGAPGISTRAMEDLAAGGVARYYTTGFGATVPLCQFGSVRCMITIASGAGIVDTLNINRTHNGVTTNLATGSTAPLIVDVGVEPGDVITFGTSLSAGLYTFGFTISTNGQNLWPGFAGLIVS